MEMALDDLLFSTRLPRPRPWWRTEIIKVRGRPWLPKIPGLRGRIADDTDALDSRLRFVAGTAFCTRV
jgi:hypothetical protein